MPNIEFFNPNFMFEGIWTPKCLMRYAATGNISRGAKDCYVVLQAFLGHNENCWPGQERIAIEMGGVSLRSVRSYIAELERDGFIHIEQRGLGKTNVYRMLPHKIFEEEMRKKSIAYPDRQNPAGQGETQQSDRNIPAGQDRNIPAGPLHLSYEEDQLVKDQVAEKLSLAANAASSDSQTDLPIGGGSGKESLKSDGLENTSMEEEPGLGEFENQTSAPSKLQTDSSKVWTLQDEKTFWSKYNAIPRVKKANAEAKRKAMDAIIRKFKASPDDALDALSGFRSSCPGSNVQEFLNHFQSYLETARQDNGPQGASTAQKRARTNLEDLKKETPADSNEINHLEAKELAGLIRLHRISLNSS